ncbi:P-loop containing nucleoside triphosphate hydrolase protein [Metschnikowia bicuspidata var. bicuspidata NRRL YB-4993]|uniref:p-loop containing nucleoside triphosphate hydrolase protein n=1 Tax=Metschnikowia bicuspidata var. bicuspidata NRRL YB-4993 TaxID=869754 RepID=A0A1A0H5L5_9ASCO|nr:P-loop containing nucleoside triphosphate hydrolase protein [Metschnikowia bicuspidata var. bicuspidata NRRL YB-4993]OBA19240.1 P-loop containing nucleoside triphosphate hydrolase protein [Metschnikowia bicuspidata var. bicuspidata NRRL YB-4993]
MSQSEYAIETTNLTYVFGNKRRGLEDISLQIPWGKTNLLVGPNGAGKSTLLKILAGKTLIKQGKLRIGGFDPFEFSINRNSHENADINNYISYLGTEWANNEVVKRDIPVKLLISSIGGEIYQDRRDELIRILDLDPDWSMAYISDGERRRVQLVMGLLKPWKLLLLDEVTVDLDVIVRQNLLNFLKKECRERNCCVIYATHIFDGLGRNWCDRVIHLNEGRKTDDIDISKINFEKDIDGVKIHTNASKEVEMIDVALAESLHPLVLQWLKDDLTIRGSREEEQARIRHKLNGWDNARDGHYFDKDAKVKDYFKATRSKQD